MRVQLFEIIQSIQCAERDIRVAEIFGNQEYIESRRDYMQAMINRYESFTGESWSEYKDNETSLSLAINRAINGALDMSYETLFSMTTEQLIDAVYFDTDFAWLVVTASEEFHPDAVRAAWDSIEIDQDSKAWNDAYSDAESRYFGLN